MNKKVSDTNGFTKPKYNIFNNSIYMILLAWNTKEKNVPIFCILIALLSNIRSLLNLYLIPSVFKMVEKEVSLSGIIKMLLFFIISMMLIVGILSYISSNVMYGRITVRKTIIAYINKKTATTSYPNMENEDFDILRTKASMAVSSNSQATEAIWETLTSLLQNISGFIIYVVLLSSLETGLFIVVIVTALGGYFINKYANGYSYRHRKELAKCEKQMCYIRECSKDYIAAKDMRMYNSNIWLKELWNRALFSYIDFHKCAENLQFWASILVFLCTFLRNGVVYIYLLYMVINNNLSLSEFILYSTAINTVAMWINGILNNLSVLYRQSNDISTVREFLEYPESFRFEIGEQIIYNKNIKYELCATDGCGAAICTTQCPRNTYRCDYPATAGLSPTNA